MIKKSIIKYLPIRGGNWPRPDVPLEKSRPFTRRVLFYLLCSVQPQYIVSICQVNNKNALDGFRNLLKLLGGLSSFFFICYIYKWFMGFTFEFKIDLDKSKYFQEICDEKVNKKKHKKALRNNFLGLDYLGDEGIHNQNNTQYQEHLVQIYRNKRQKQRKANLEAYNTIKRIQKEARQHVIHQLNNKNQAYH